MSYILDALRRADAERERGAVPSLHTQQYGALPGDDDAPQRPRRLVGAIVVLVLALGGVLAWNFWGGGDATRHGAGQGTVSTMPAPTPPAPAVAATPVPAIAPAPAMSTTVPPVAVSPPPVATSPPVPAATRRLNAAAAQATAPDRRRAARTAAPSASASAPSPDVGQGKLPEALRRELPTLAFGGASYSNDATSRMVIFNGRVFHEGDTIAPQLVLQQIKLKSAIFTYKGYRYEIEY